MSSPPSTVDLTGATCVFFYIAYTAAKFTTQKKVKEEYFKMCGSEQRGMEAYSSER
jgi:hypothetical protein